MISNDVILVNEADESIGQMEKMQAHLEGKLHRAFSVFVFNSEGEMLIHKRALDKYHSPGLWTNACCSHPMPGEPKEAAVVRRMQEEIGLRAPFRHLFHFVYRAELENDLIEHELDHVFLSITDDEPIINPKEVAEFKYIDPHELLTDIKSNPEHYTAWFKLIVDRVVDIHAQLQ